MSELAGAWLHAHSAELAEQTIETLYAGNPFWAERFGDRGRSFAVEDNRHHLSTLEQALRADDPLLLTNYARWLQAVLTTRGMCSRPPAAKLRRARRCAPPAGLRPEPAPV